MVISDKFLDEQTREKRIVQVTWFAQIAMALASFQPILAKSLLNLSMLIVFIVGLYGCRILAKQHKLDLAANAISILLTLMVLIFCWLNQGIRDEILLIFPALITFAVLTGTERLLWGLFAVIACNIMIMALVNELNLYQHHLSDSGLLSGIIIIIILSVITYSIKILGSDVRLANKKLRQHQETLESEVASRTKELEQTVEQLTSATDALIESEKMASLGRIVAGVAHEINTPLGIAITAASLINEKTDETRISVSQGEITKKCLEQYLTSTSQSIQMIENNLKRAGNLVSDFKQAAVLGNDERKTHFNLYDVIQEAVSASQTLQTDENIQVKVNGDSAIYIEQDRDVIERIITNLYRNSCLHGFDNGTDDQVTINLEQRNETIIINYYDNGKGLDDYSKEHIFEPFYTTKRGQGGTGLGMHIVFNLVTQSLGGSIEIVEPELNGVHFIIQFTLN